MESLAPPMLNSTVGEDALKDPSILQRPPWFVPGCYAPLVATGHAQSGRAMPGEKGGRDSRTQGVLSLYFAHRARALQGWVACRSLPASSWRFGEEAPIRPVCWNAQPRGSRSVYRCAADRPPSKRGGRGEAVPVAREELGPSGLAYPSRFGIGWECGRVSPLEKEGRSSVRRA